MPAEAGIQIRFWRNLEKPGFRLRGNAMKERGHNSMEVKGQSCKLVQRALGEQLFDFKLAVRYTRHLGITRHFF